ncbi:MAG: ASKHA domain-containing protein [Clostridiales bacterium]|nr:ASKHA domain-containing protein [Eubacteriales bacterium]MDH7565664.1 ASKHA domain-containing protein [Clostridiales bacterium]
MEKFQVTIMPENIAVSVEKGTNLLLAASAAGISIESPCGGRGTCGKCAVRVIEGRVEVGDDTHISDDLKASGYIPACQARVMEDVAVEVPSFSRLTRHKVVLENKKTKYSKENDYFAAKKMNPICQKLHLELGNTDLADNINDLDRVKAVLATQYGIKNPNISLDVLRRLPTAIREGNWEITLTVSRVKGITEIIDVEPGKSERPLYGMAVDIGTTTVVVYLVNTTSGKVIDRAGDYNRQATYGSDVISRIIYGDENPDGMEILQEAVVGTINGLVQELLAKNGLKSSDIPVMVCAGNTVMTHLLLKVQATYLRLEPYVPCAVKFPVVKAKELNIGINPEAIIVTLPSVASYVGGDITAGVLATMLTCTDKLTLFIDVGTNGELVLGNSDWLVTCSCSAGPAFEGSGITSGMRAMDGAIDWIDIDRETLEVTCRTIGDVKPLGICGSGLIYSLAEMADAGIIDRAGKILESKVSRRIRRRDDGVEYVLVFAEESGSGQDIVITEGDVKNLLRAKGAIFAGIRTMLQQVQMDLSDIENVYIAGGFGKYINIADAIKIGLLPDLPDELFEYVGNSSIQGAVIVLLCQEALEEAEAIADKMTYLELSLGNTFMDEFVSALFIPHTDLSLFPSLKKDG